MYACLITNLYNEYQFHSKYPEKELQMTGTLFGGVIEREIVEGKTLQIGLQIINVSLKNSNIRYEFGIKALEAIKGRVWEWQQFSEQVLCESEVVLERNPQVLDDILKVCQKKGVALNVPQSRLDAIRNKVSPPVVQPLPQLLHP